MVRPLELSDAHLAAFSAQQRQRFEDNVWILLQKRQPAKCTNLGEVCIRELIRKGTQAAREFDIVLEPDVVSFVELMLTISPDFDNSDKTSWAKKILTQSGRTGRQKLDQVFAHLALESPKPSNR